MFFEYFFNYCTELITVADISLCISLWPSAICHFPVPSFPAFFMRFIWNETVLSLPLIPPNVLPRPRLSTLPDKHQINHPNNIRPAKYMILPVTSTANVKRHKFTCMLVVLLLALLLSDSLIPAVTSIKLITFCLHTKMMKTHNPWRVFIPSKMYLKWSANSLIENTPSELSKVYIYIYIYLSYQIGWSLPSCKSPATISSDQKKPIPMNIFKYKMILQLLWNVWYMTAVICENAYVFIWISNVKWFTYLSAISPSLFLSLNCCILP